MKKLLPLVPLALFGCSSDPAPKPDVQAPAVRYQMVPATTGGTGGSAPAGAAPAPSAGPANPPSLGSD